MDLSALERLARLRDSGVLSEEEFQFQKGRLLSQPEQQQRQANPDGWTLQASLRLLGALLIVVGVVAFLMFKARPDAASRPASTYNEQGAPELNVETASSPEAEGAAIADATMTADVLPKDEDPTAWTPDEQLQNCKGRWTSSLDKGKGAISLVLNDSAYELSGSDGSQLRGEWWGAGNVLVAVTLEHHEGNHMLSECTPERALLELPNGRAVQLSRVARD